MDGRNKKPAYRFHEGDFIICKPAEAERNERNKDFEVYARVVSVDREKDTLVLDCYLKQGKLQMENRINKKLPLSKFENEPMYQPMNLEEVSVFQDSLIEQLGGKISIASPGWKVMMETFELSQQALTRATLEPVTRIDANCEPAFGSDQMYDSYPVKFPCVTFALVPTLELNDAAEEMRRRNMEDTGNITEHSEFEYSIGIYEKVAGEGRAESCITVLDGDNTYLIDLTENESKTAYELLDRQCVEAYGKGCGELLGEAREEMERCVNLDTGFADTFGDIEQ